MNYEEQVKKAHEDGLISDGTLENVNIWLNGEKYREYLDELMGLIETEEWEIIEDNFFMVRPLERLLLRMTGVDPARIPTEFQKHGGEQICKPLNISP